MFSQQCSYFGSSEYGSVYKKGVKDRQTACGKERGRLITGPSCSKTFRGGEQRVPSQTRRAPVPKHRAPMGGVQANDHLRA